MSLKDMTKEELEVLSYTDLTYMLLKENKKTMNTPTLFKKICELLEFTDEEYAAKIGDYYTSLTIDKRFILLDNGEWDICDNHKIEMVVEDDEEESEDEMENLDDELDDDDDLEDLAIIDDEENDEE